MSNKKHENFSKAFEIDDSGKKNYFKCVNCEKEYQINQVRFRCEDCGDILDIEIDEVSVSRKTFDARLGAQKGTDVSGVWRFKEILPAIPEDSISTRKEGNTRLYYSEILNKKLGLDDFHLKHEGENPTLSFKDRGMTVAISRGIAMGYEKFVCASTGNTSASLASYCAHAGKQGVILVPDGKVSMGKLSQALALGAKVLQVKGNFDDAMKIVIDESEKLGLYILNSINPFRVEGQKTIVWEIFQNLNWEIPDWIVLPAGNLGNTSAFGKAIREAKKFGLIKKTPRIASIQAEGANPFFLSFKNDFQELEKQKNPETIATAIRIGAPVSWKKARRAILETDGVVEEVSDEEIMNAKALIDNSGIGCEPASACSVAGLIKLKKKGIIKKSDKVVGILTGNLLKDPDATFNYHFDKLPYPADHKNEPIVTEATPSAIQAALDKK